MQPEKRLGFSKKNLNERPAYSGTLGALRLRIGPSGLEVGGKAFGC